MAYKYYYFKKGFKSFFSDTNLQSALASASHDEKKVFCHTGVPNPHIVFPIVNGKVYKEIVIRGSEEMKLFSQIGLEEYQKTQIAKNNKIDFKKKISKL